MKPSSFCCISTNNSVKELAALLYSLSKYHNNEKVYLLLDSFSNIYLKNYDFKLNLEIHILLDKYTKKSRDIMEKENIWNDFQMMKAKAIEIALEKSKDVLFLDSDIIITDIINDIDNTKDIGVSPQFISQKYINETGYYNGGMLWVQNKDVPNDWIEFTKTSRFHDQASIEDLVKKYTYFEFQENYNLLCWRLYLNNESIISYIQSYEDGRIEYKKKPLKCIHTHFNQKRFEKFNNIIISHLKKAKRSDELKAINIIN
jgi:hypothetical protein